MKWEDLSELARDVMEDMGNFGPTIKPGSREVKGATYDDVYGGVIKTYYSSSDLREIASACNEVADWLDKRAEIEERMTKLRVQGNAAGNMWAASGDA
jgi:hypothetical protein